MDIDNDDANGEASPINSAEDEGKELKTEPTAAMDIVDNTQPVSALASNELFLNSKSNQEDTHPVQLFDQDVGCSAADFEDDTVVKMQDSCEVAAVN